MTGQAGKYVGRLGDKVVLIVGGTSGIGYAVAEAALEHNAIVIIAGSNPVKLEQAVSRLKLSYPSQSSKTRLRGITIDLADAENLEENVQSVLRFAANGGKINHAIITAADMMPPPPPLTEITVQSLERSSRIRYTAPLIFAKYLPQFMDRVSENSLTLTSGAHGHKPDPGWSAITGYIGAVETMMKGLAVDLKPLRVNAVSPGAIITEVVREMLGPHYDMAIQMAKDKSLVGSAGTPESVAQAYLYLMKDQFVTGTVLETNGGLLLA
ncbi:Glucose/ribitol dehydrogenase [Penicillium concentricum]|uniref:Glucose/ribitol dehydrogenase n=1 Tax=Penicillium concentricum TaxID=293559 RepID=A0A9W9SU07_9EURO|nr:Glucose/ribitol dehydrogenase [Penicillium concentricum]KAJ5382498.1 Glucose/ribitol dehydrogenase [Penicillium concentricum]